MDFIWMMLAGAVLFGVIGVAVKAPGNELARKFASAGTLTGKTAQEIVAIVGPPNSVSAIGGGRTLCQWMATGYHVALRFNGDICEGVTHETKV